MARRHHPDPAAHSAHHRPLAHRIVSAEIKDFIAIACDTAAAGAGTSTAEERARQEAIREMRHLHLSGVDYQLTPLILSALRRAGCLVPAGVHVETDVEYEVEPGRPGVTRRRTVTTVIGPWEPVEEPTDD